MTHVKCASCKKKRPLVSRSDLCQECYQAQQERIAQAISRLNKQQGVSGSLEKARNQTQDKSWNAPAAPMK